MSAKRERGKIRRLSVEEENLISEKLNNIRKKIKEKNEEENLLSNTIEKMKELILAQDRIIESQNNELKRLSFMMNKSPSFTSTIQYDSNIVNSEVKYG